MRYSIEQTTLEQVLNYLAMKPYAEVAQIISLVQSDIKQIEEVKTDGICDGNN